MIRRLAKKCCWNISWVEQHHTEFMFNLHNSQSNQHHEHIFLEQTDMINNFYFTPLVGATWADQHHTEFMFNPPRRVSGQRSSLPFSDRRQLHLSKSFKILMFFAYLWKVESPIFTQLKTSLTYFPTIAPNLGENVELRSVSISICCHSRWKVPIQTC